MTAEKFPYEKISTIEDLGKAVQLRRKGVKLTQGELAGLCNVGTRFISDLENGKPTLEFSKVLTVLHRLGLELKLASREWPERY